MSAFRPGDPTPPRERIAIVANVLHGVLYVWGGNALEQGGLDCSGFVQRVYAEAGIEPFASQFPSRLDLTAGGLFAQLAPIDPTVEHPLPGDCAFYGSGPGAVSHVMLVTYHEPGGRTQVVGASRGDRACSSPDVALAKGARVKTFPTHDYRRDFLGFRRMPGA